MTAALTFGVTIALVGVVALAIVLALAIVTIAIIAVTLAVAVTVVGAIAVRYALTFVLTLALTIAIALARARLAALAAALTIEIAFAVGGEFLRDNNRSDIQRESGIHSTFPVNQHLALQRYFMGNFIFNKEETLQGRTTIYSFN